MSYHVFQVSNAEEFLKNRVVSTNVNVAHGDCLIIHDGTNVVCVGGVDINTPNSVKVKLSKIKKVPLKSVELSARAYEKVAEKVYNKAVDAINKHVDPPSPRKPVRVESKVQTVHERVQEQRAEKEKLETKGDAVSAEPSTPKKAPDTPKQEKNKPEKQKKQKKQNKRKNNVKAPTLELPDDIVAALAEVNESSTGN